MTSTSVARHLYAAERHEQIVAAARAAGRVDVVELAEQLGVTPETIRRDLTSLERGGLVRRVHGGALPVAPAEDEPTFLERQGRATGEKGRIALAALNLVPASGVVLLDAGTTTQALAQLLPIRPGLTVVTNSVAIAAALTDRSDLTVHMLGGPVRERTGAAVGSWAVRALEEMAVDVAFLGTNGFSVERGFTTPDDAEADVKRAMVQCARRVVVLADASKAGLAQFRRFAAPGDVDVLITDERLDDETAEALEEAGPEVLRT